MRNLKRALSLALASVMLLGMMVVGTGASYADVTSKHNQEAIEVIQAIGVMAGDDKGNFNPDQKVTRGEMAVVMANLLKLNVKDFIGAKTPFTDVPEWAVPYVAACYADGITAGISATEYGFNYEVTTAQAALMMMKALGYFQYASDFGSDWQVATVKQGTKIALFEGINSGATAAMTRNDVAQIALNTLKANVVEVEGNDGISIGDITIGSSIKYVDLKVDTTGGKNAYALAFGGTAAAETTVQLGEQLFKGDLSYGADKDGATTDSFGRSAKTWVYKNENVFTVADDAKYTVVADDNAATETTATNVIAEIKDEANNKNLTFTGTTYTVNGDPKTASTIDLKKGDVVDVYVTDGTNAVTSVFVTRYSYDKVTTNPNANVSAADKDAGVKYTITLENSAKTKDTEIPGFNAATYVKDAVIAVAAKTDGTILDSYVVSKVSGSVSSYTSAGNFNAATDITMGGKKYVVSGNADISDLGTTADFKNGEYALYLDANGYVLYAETVTASASIEDVVYVASTYITENKDYGVSTFKQYAQVVALDGTVQNVLMGTFSYVATGIAADTDKVPVGETYYTFSGTTPTPVSAGTDMSDGVVYYSLKGAYTGVTAGNLYTYENVKNEDYKTFTAYTTDVTTPTLSADLKSDTVKIGTSTNTTFLTNNTKYILVEGDKANIKVNTYTGGISFDDAKVTAIKAACTVDGNNNKVASCVFLTVTDSELSSEAKTDLLYAYTTDKVYVDGGVVVKMYNMKGETVDVKMTTTEYATISEDQFYEYSVDSDGLYDLTVKTELASGVDVNDKDFKSGVLLDVTFTSLYNTKITGTNSGNAAVDVVEAGKAVIIDTRTDSEKDADAYSGAITSLNLLVRADELGTVKFNAYVTSEGIQIIFISDFT